MGSLKRGGPPVHSHHATRMEENEKPGEMADSRRLTGRKKSNQENRRTEARKLTVIMRGRTWCFERSQRWPRKCDGNLVESGRRQPPLHECWLKHRWRVGETTGRAKLDDVIGIAGRCRLREDSQSTGDDAVVVAYTTVTMVQNQL